jgi:hypothetical protein
MSGYRGGGPSGAEADDGDIDLLIILSRAHGMIRRLKPGLWTSAAQASARAMA